MKNSEKIKKCYEEIFNGCIGKQFKGRKDNSGKNTYGLEELSHFTAMAGPKYGENGCKKMMLIGRAVNGWMKFQDIKNAEDFGQRALQSMLDSKFNWVKEDENGRGLRNNKSSEKDGKDYFLNKSPFWRVTREIFGTVTNADKNGKWVDYVAWSNLYKISYENGGNPSLEMMQAQMSGCRNLLKQEIEYYEPDFILVVVGWGMFNDFNLNKNKDGDGVVFSDVKQKGINKSRGKDKNEIYVEATAKYKLGDRDIPVIITCRPERRNERKFIDDVVRNLQS